ncbi:hypothetical protein [Chitinophaga sp. Cy-1792]|uniref:hypothetical protein n=1 Tax=Chitinophaga sp. Cy-1792 TaxID=2608339 RepID=UPI00141F0B92|nr:hypothetical protein [Chitinophaga sp. Cy-1792]NIG53352.1 hypothetical protein [Chitinophaga sp. Cy-1792]
MLSCNNSSKNYQFYKGKVSISYKSKEDGYTWNFSRNYTDTLAEVSRTEVASSSLLSIKQIDTTLMGALDFKNGTIHFLSAKDLRSLFTFSLHKRTQIMNYEYINNDLRFYDFSDRRLKIFHRESNPTDQPDFKQISTRSIPASAAVFRAMFLTDSTTIHFQPNEKSADANFIIRNLFAGDSIKHNYDLKEIIGTKDSVPGIELAYDGNFISASNSNYVVFHCSFTGFFIAFDKATGEFRYASKTVDQTPAPKAYYKEIAPGVQHQEISPNVTFFPGSSIDGNQLFLLNSINADKVPTVDIYDLSAGGKYRKSFYIPELDNKFPPMSIAVSGNVVSVMYRKSIIVKYLIKSDL